MRINSPDFENGKRIPKAHTLEGENKIPKLLIRDVPKQAKELALICEDPDAPRGIFTHWLAWSIPPEVVLIEDGLDKKEGTNDFDQIGYSGPMPPIGHGTHHYHFQVFALNEPLLLDSETTRQDLLKAMEGKVIAVAETMATYSR